MRAAILRHMVGILDVVDSFSVSVMERFPRVWLSMMDDASYRYYLRLFVSSLHQRFGLGALDVLEDAIADVRGGEI